MTSPEDTFANVRSNTFTENARTALSTAVNSSAGGEKDCGSILKLCSA